MRSKNYYDALAWAKKVIASCETQEQCMTTYKLLRNLQCQWRDTSHYYSMDHYLLQSELNCKREELRKPKTIDLVKNV